MQDHLKTHSSPCLPYTNKYNSTIHNNIYITDASHCDNINTHFSIQY